jgi:hypothetical protein
MQQMKLFALSDREAGAPMELASPGPGYPKAVNAEGYGIFHVVNDYEGRRVVENLKRINYWYADLDTGTKEEQLERIAKHLKPTRVVETKKGFHVYWKAIDATLGNWERIVKRGVVPALEADPRASDPLRLLRVPGFYHHKGEPYLVRTVAQADVAYRETQMLDAFPDLRALDIVEKVDSRRALLGGDASFWMRVAGLPAREVIKRLSGTALVKREQFKLHETTGGKANILVKKPGKTRWESTPCWVTGDNTLAGVEGGSSAAAFCKWYSLEWKQIAEGLKELFPELNEG